MFNQLFTRFRLRKALVTRVVAVVVVAAAAAVGTLAVTATARRPRPTDFAILSGHLRPHDARISSVPIPAGGVLAGQFGTEMVYARTRVSGQLGEEICVEALNTASPTQSSAAACDPRAFAEQNGVTLTEMPTTVQSTIAMFVLVPKGVKTVQFVTSDGTKTVEVINNVATAEGLDLQSLHYAVNGVEHTLNTPSAPPLSIPAG